MRGHLWVGGLYRRILTRGGRTSATSAVRQLQLLTPASSLVRLSRGDVL